jgi:hypothetical protein
MRQRPTRQGDSEVYNQSNSIVYFSNDCSISPHILQLPARQAYSSHEFDTAPLAALSREIGQAGSLTLPE